MSLPNNIDVLNCNIALHYFIDTFPLIVKKTNPKFINLLIIDGSKLKESETLYEDSNVKYHYNKIKDSANKEVI